MRCWRNDILEWTRNGKNLRYGGSVTEAKNEFGGTIYSSGHGTEQNFKVSGSVAEQPFSVDTERNKFSKSAEAWRKRGETAILGGHETEQIFIVGVSVAEAWRNNFLGRSGRVVPFRYYPW